ncbi:PLP-dependent transferase [Panus rudis PR-1116 ss-1]|nr:PLP-dependent transferase [Panus rudis PR-1116 ss-1]
MSSDKLYTYDPESKPPPFGHPLRKYWAFDDSYVNLNNGSYGAQPLPVFRDSQNIALLSEQNPDKFHRFTYLPLLEESRKLVAELIGAEHDEIVLVPNATHGINTILRNMEWRDGDILLGASTTYDAVSKTLKYLGDRSESPRPSVHNMQFAFPARHADLLNIFRTRIRELKQAQSDIRFTNVPSDALLPEGFERDPNGNRFVVVIDSIVSNPGVRLPWQEMVRIAKEEGIWTVIDAAHSIGQEVNINLSATKPDFWVSNCHKWLYVKRGCAALYVPRRNQYLIKSSIPTSHDYVSPSDPKFRNVGTAFAQQHRWTGTADLSPYLSIKSALNFRKWLGGEEAINAYCHDLALKGGKKLAEVLNTRVMDDTGELTWNMTNVQLPLPVQQPDQEKIYTDEQLRKVYSTLVTKMLDEWNTCVAVFFHNGGWWARASAQVWNEISDFEYAGKALNAICKEIKDDPGSTKLDSALRK